MRIRSTEIIRLGGGQAKVTVRCFRCDRDVGTALEQVPVLCVGCTLRRPRFGPMDPPYRPEPMDPPYRPEPMDPPYRPEPMDPPYRPEPTWPATYGPPTEKLEVQWVG